MEPILFLPTPHQRLPKLTHRFICFETRLLYQGCWFLIHFSQQKNECYVFFLKDFIKEYSVSCMRHLSNLITELKCHQSSQTHGKAYSLRPNLHEVLHSSCHAKPYRDH